MFLKNQEIFLSKGYDVDNGRSKSTNSRAFRDLSSFLELTHLLPYYWGVWVFQAQFMVYIKSKIQIVVVLRCMGMQAKEAINIYLIQVGLASSVHQFVPFGSRHSSIFARNCKIIIPFDIQPIIGLVIIAGLIIGVVTSILFGLLSYWIEKSKSPLRHSFWI